MLLHGLTATRRYVVMGSRSLERSGHRVVAYDARGHGRSAPAPEPRAYGYELLARRPAWPCSTRWALRARGARRRLDGRAHGAALRADAARARRRARADHARPSTPTRRATERELARWDALARGLREGGVEGFVRGLRPRRGARALARDGRDACCASASPRTSTRWRSPTRSKPCRARARSSGSSSSPRIDVPTVVVASRDEADPGHPLAVGERYAATIPGARAASSRSRAPPRSPIAWQGGQLSQRDRRARRAIVIRSAYT